ncbi:hypothetical protein ABWW58_01840 [Sporolactobacillus sp. STCC-11]|uniref:hypothetical protein n=1 Tax=Sporolactobacillus caesalpiniae TaxID=3230362 RepID=UPI0033982AC5
MNSSHSFLKVVISLVAVTIVSFAIVNATYALSIKSTAFSPTILKVYTNGVDVNQKEWGPTHYVANLGTTEQKNKKKYYTASFYENRTRNMTSFGGMILNFSNPNKSTIRFNFSLNDGSKKIWKVGNRQFVAFKEKKDKYWESSQAEYGAISIPKGFDGQIYIPFSSLNKEKNKLNLSNIKSWGVSFTLNANQQRRVIFGNFSLVNKRFSLKANKILDQLIIGDDFVQIPVAQSSIAEYTIRSAYKGQSKPVFKMASDLSGVSISKRGTLSISKPIKPQTIRILALSPDGSRSSKAIHLYESWTAHRKASDGVPYKIPNVNQVKSPMHVDSFLVNNRFMHWMRVAIVSTMIILTLIYFWCRRMTIKRYHN